MTEQPGAEQVETEQVETLEFQTEARQLLQLMIHSVYSHKDTFLRELVSNASDALDKLRLEALKGEVSAEIDDLHIDLEPDPGARTLTVRDNGIGMSRDEVVGLIGTIAKSGTAEFIEQLRKADDAASQELIGQFGIGFYSSFMVADRVTLVTRRAGGTEGVRWESDGAGSYTLQSVPDAPAGTAVTLHLKPADEEEQLRDYTAAPVLTEIVKRYSDFLSWPIRLLPAPETTGETDDEADTTEPATINSRRALWTRPQSEVTEEEYAEFYRTLAHDWTEPLDTIRLQAEGTFEYQALLFLPRKAPMDLFMREHRSGLQLYVKRVFIMDDCEALMPDYLRFVRGVVDAADLSLNVSREILQQDRQIARMRGRLVRRVLQAIATMQTDRPEDYTTFWSELGQALKEGLITDGERRAEILPLCSFASTHDPERLTTLADYKSRMAEGQEHIYYLTGESRAAVEGSPHLEGLRESGYEVLILTDQVDEVWVDAVGEFDGTSLQSVAKGQVDLRSDEQKSAAEQADADFADLLAWMGPALGEQVKEVRLSHRLTSSPSVVVGDENDISPALARMFASMGQEVPPSPRFLELNPSHPLVAALHRSFEQTAEADRGGLTETAELLYGLAVLAEGGELPDPARFVAVVASQAERGLSAASGS